MPNSYYNHSAYPAPNAPGSSAALRAELDLVTAGFNKLPTLAGNAGKLVAINGAGDALVAVTAFSGIAITGSTIDNSPIGGTTPSTGVFTTIVANSGITGNLTGNVTGNVTGNLTGNVTSAGTSTFANLVGTGGTLDNIVIGATTAQTIRGTTITATTGFVGPLTGNVTGNVTGNLTGNVTGNVVGNVTGNVTGNLTGNVTANSGTSTFNNVTINGQLDMDAGSSATIINLSNPTNAGDAANKGYVDTQDALRLALAGGTMSGAIAMGTNKITGLGTPTADADAATKGYVDSVAQGLDVKGSVVVATTGNITLSGTQTIDGVAVTAGQRVLVKDQTAPAENGVYVVAAGAWTRSTDMDAWTEFPGAFVFVEQGSTNDNSGWVCTVSAGGTLGVTAVTFEQFSGAGQITAGTGMTKSGNTLNVNTASASRIVVNSDNIDLATTGVTGGTYRSVTVDVYGRITAGTNPTTLAGYAISDAYTITQVDTALAAKLNLSGGTMTGAIAMGTYRITGLGDPSAAQDAATKNYIDTLFGSTSSAAASAAAAALSASAASTSATSAASSASTASSAASTATAAATAAAASYDDFDDRYLGAKSSPPTVDNDGNPLITGALYFDTSANEMRVWTGSVWKATGSAVNGTSNRVTYTAAAGQTTFAITYDVGYVDVYMNGLKLQAGIDFTATTGTNIVLQTGATAGDIVDIVAYGAFEVANVLPLTGGTMSGAINFVAGQTFPGAGISFSKYTANVTATNMQGIIADTSAGSFTVTLPATPSAGAMVSIVDGADWGTNNLTVGRNGSTIEGAAEDLTVDIGGAALDLIYSGTTWQVYAQVGGTSGNLVTVSATQTLTNKTLVDPILTLGSTQGAAGQVLLSQGAGTAPVWGDQPVGFSSGKALFFSSF